ncbi:MAG: transglutaminase family protein [Burkholderiales bacterium]|nr:transglutaminase family protein [Burkholderiales bacterium]MBK8667364.1 transglutaminase family protein [Burkholderiales bacterium]
MNDQPTPAHLAPTPAIDSGHPAVQAFAREHVQGADERTRAVALTHAVRDAFLYDPYRIDLTPYGMRASTVIEHGYGWCVPKAVLLAACARAVGLPARLGFADVRNHLSTARMRETLQTDVYRWHGYTELWLGGAWRKATPAFNLSLCEKFGLLPLDFDGVHDSIYHPFDKAGNRHMEYVNERGSFDDLPLAAIVEDFHQHYPLWVPGNELNRQLLQADFLADVARETGSDLAA